jgi:hypothetical protein
MKDFAEFSDRCLSDELMDDFETIAKRNPIPGVSGDGKAAAKSVMFIAHGTTLRMLQEYHEWVQE